MLNESKSIKIDLFRSLVDLSSNKLTAQPLRMNLDTLLLAIPAFGLLALLFTWWKTNEVNSIPEGTERMSKIAKSIQDGAMAFLRAEYRILIIFVAG